MTNTWQVAIVIFNLFILESLLSVDNATALAAMVKHLPTKQQNKALRYGLLGAYVFRGLCLAVASWLISYYWLKIAGGLYLEYLTFKYFYNKNDGDENTNGIAKGLWGTIIAVEIMDLTLSMDNVFAAVALSNTLWVIMVGVGIGILAMRFIAGWFVKLINKYPSLETSAYIVISLLGLKLILTGIIDYLPSMITLKNILELHITDFIFSGCMMTVFFIPLLKRKKLIIV
jgi:YkoY family integral membrane protein